MVKLKDDEVRVNKTCISISRKLYDEAGAKDYASFHFHKYGGMTITFSDTHHFNSCELLYRSENVVEYNKIALEKFEGAYSGTVSNGRISAKRIDQTKSKQHLNPFYEVLGESTDTQENIKRMPLLIYEDNQEPK